MGFRFFLASSVGFVFPVRILLSDGQHRVYLLLSSKRPWFGNSDLTFKSRLNETYTTIPIVFDDSDLHDFVRDIQLALLNLPNRVIDGVTVTAGNTFDGMVRVNVTFTGNAVQGPQHLLIVEDYECGAGCTPRLDGLDVQTRLMAQSNVSEARLADYNSFECGRRGKCDYATGLCQCFTGYTGDNCNTLTTLT